MNPRNLMAAAVIVVAALATACSSAATPVPATPAPAIPAAAASSAPPAASGPVIKTATVGSQGTLIVASSNGMTVYTFANDVKDSGKSACTGGCITKWPALTVPSGSTPTGDTGVTGKIGTITRDDGTIQVTYNGLPLYFYATDKAPGDANGIYTNWSAVKP
jgi:predicted lipoprotein with Yx(FWY)xxD motif